VRRGVFRKTGPFPSCERTFKVLERHFIGNLETSWDAEMKLHDAFVKGGLKGPKLEIFGSRVFPQIRPVCVGDLGTRRKNSKF
jgi:hypothetical protein